VREVTARAPVRIDFGGGWTDVPPYPQEEGGCVCNLAIARYATARLTDRGVALHVDAHEEDQALPLAALERAGVSHVSLDLRNDFPRGAGLGGSSAAGVAIQAALASWRGESLEATALAERSRAVETEGLQVPGGSQDHYAAALGGALELRFGTAVEARRIALPPARRAEIERRCIVGFTGESRLSGRTITAVIDAYRAREPRVTAALARMKALAARMAQALEHGSIDELSMLVDEHWQFQRSLHARISTPGIERVLDMARRAGATGGKALGASGGGSVLVIAPDAAVDAVRAAVASVAVPLPFTIDLDGARLVDIAVPA
jgi:D-glycero-alpha-D-manno-heptose-7-phosphate kinase